MLSIEALFLEQGKSRFQAFLPCSVFDFSLLQVPQQNICRNVAGDGKRFGQELGVYLLGEVSVFMGEHFRDDIHAELAAVGEADGEVMPQSVERAEALGKSSGHAEAINGRAVRAEIYDFKSDNFASAEEYSIYTPQMTSYQHSLAKLLDLPLKAVSCHICALKIKEVIHTIIP